MIPKPSVRPLPTYLRAAVTLFIFSAANGCQRAARPESVHIPSAAKTHDTGGSDSPHTSGGISEADRTNDAHESLPEVLIPRDTQALAFGDPQADCARCHPNHVSEWEISNHAYAAVDPVFHAMVRLGQQQSQGKLGQFCVQCHTPPGLALGQTPVRPDPASGHHQQDLSNLDAVAKQGVSCDVCHSIENVIEPVNARLVMTPNGVKRGTIAHPVATPAHQSRFSTLHQSSRLCGSCHSVTNPKGALVEETFSEWQQSTAANQGKTCQTCHMPEYEGQAATDGPQRTVHRHHFVGVDVSLLPEDDFPGYHDMRERTAKLLRSAAAMHAKMAGSALHISIRNHAGHALPSGSTAERQMWLEVVVRDRDSQTIVFESGTLDSYGDIRDGLPSHSTAPGTDPHLVYYGQQMVHVPGLDALNDVTQQAAREAARARATADCRPMAQGALAPYSPLTPVSFPWQANWQCNYLLPPDTTHRHSYNLSDLPPGAYQATVVLKFRTFPPYFLRELEAQAGLDPQVKHRVPTVNMAQHQLTFEVQ